MLVSITAKQNKAGANNMDKTLADYIKRISEQEKKQPEPAPKSEDNDYKVYPEDDGYDRPRNPFSSV